MNGWLAQHLDPVIYGLVVWLATAVGVCLLVAASVAVTWLVWIRYQWRWKAFVRIRNGRRLRRAIGR